LLAPPEHKDHTLWWAPPRRGLIWGYGWLCNHHMEGIIMS